MLEKWLCRYLLLLEERGLLEWWVFMYALANHNRVHMAELVLNLRLDGKADVPSRCINKIGSCAVRTAFYNSTKCTRCQSMSVPLHGQHSRYSPAEEHTEYK